VSGRAAVTVVGALASLAIACGSNDESLFKNGQDGTGGASSGQPGALGEDQMPQGTASACVSGVTAADLLPTNLVFMYDKSGSMGDVQTGFDPSKRWVPVGAGLRDFFAAPESKSLNASLQFFPQGGDLADVCAYPYATPRVPLSPLTSSGPFVAAIDAESPSGGTPTVPALAGALSYAEGIAASRPGEKVAVVLVTDGEPGFWNDSSKSVEPGCADNTIAGAQALAARASAQGIAVYVVGVGPALGNLNAIASAGGTAAAQMIDVSDPTQTKAKFLTSLNAIRKQTLSCTFSIPPAPDGRALDYNAVNVVVTDAAGTQKVLGYSKTCADPRGWHYDDPQAPKHVELCQDACTSAQAAESAKLELAFGCKTQSATK
jgi:hypothetical protein